MERGSIFTSTLLLAIFLAACSLVAARETSDTCYVMVDPSQTFGHPPHAIFVNEDTDEIIGEVQYHIDTDQFITKRP